MKDNKTKDSGKQRNEGYNPLQHGYSPIHGNLDESKPPKGGSGVPNKPVKSDSSASSKKSN
ncbi:hypothetical protein ISS30_01150 [bacterium]|nr:hypothetical protein [FCB group bacterium]MBL7190277.1 hypothetical protein [bacterium]